MCVDVKCIFGSITLILLPKCQNTFNRVFCEKEKVMEKQYVATESYLFVITSISQSDRAAQVSVAFFFFTVWRSPVIDWVNWVTCSHRPVTKSIGSGRQRARPSSGATH